MIKNQIVINNDWKRCEELYNKLKRVMNLREGYKMLNDDYNDENSLINFNLIKVNDDSFDEYFSRSFNSLIIDYVTKKPEIED